MPVPSLNYHQTEDEKGKGGGGVRTSLNNHNQGPFLSKDKG